MKLAAYPGYKRSGVQWLGRVPEHWQVIPIRYVARLESGHTPSRNHPEYWEDCIVPWFTLAMLALLIGGVSWLAMQTPKPLTVKSGQDLGVELSVQNP